MTRAMHAILDRLPNLRLDPAQAPPHTRHHDARAGTHSRPVRLTRLPAMKKLEGMTAIVTGAGQGVGLGIAKRSRPTARISY